MSTRTEEVGNIYGRLTVVSYAGKRYGRTLWQCLCVCGNICFTLGQSLRAKKVGSCGCYSKEIHTTHGLNKHKINGVYRTARARCTNPKNAMFKCYGARGIEFRLGTFEEFATRMLPTWAEGLTLDRKDNDGHYEYDNIRWVSQKEQARNTSRNVLITYNGETLILADWAARIGITPEGLSWRVKKWGVEKALSVKYTSK